MKLLRLYWQKICEPLDGLLWHRDINHSLIRPLLRNEILACGAALLAGGIVYAVFPWLFWLGVGMLCMVWIFWSWAKFFLRIPLGTYSAAFLRAILLRFGFRLLILGVVFYICLAQLHAPVSAILAGLVAGSLLALVYFAIALRSG